MSPLGTPQSLLSLLYKHRHTLTDLKLALEGLNDQMTMENLAAAISHGYLKNLKVLSLEDCNPIAPVCAAMSKAGVLPLLHTLWLKGSNRGMAGLMHPFAQLFSNEQSLPNLRKLSFSGRYIGCNTFLDLWPLSENVIEGGSLLVLV